MRRKSKVSVSKEEFVGTGRVQGEPLAPVRVVERELTRPDGTTIKVRVPVYPPFRLKSRPPAKNPRSRKGRSSW